MTHTRKKILSPLLIDTLKEFKCYSFAMWAFEFDPDAKNINNESLLFIAASEAHFEIVKWLIDLDAVIDPSHPQNKTPLDIAAEKALNSTPGLYKNAYVKIVNYLIAKGANIKNDQMIKDLLYHHSNSIEPKILPDQQRKVSRQNHTEAVYTNRTSLLNQFFPSQAKSKNGDICDELNRITQSSGLPAWTYMETRDQAFTLIKNPNNVDVINLKKNGEYLLKKGLFSWLDSTTPGEISLVIFQPNPKLIARIPEYKQDLRLDRTREQRF